MKFKRYKIVGIAVILIVVIKLIVGCSSNDEWAKEKSNYLRILSSPDNASAMTLLKEYALEKGYTIDVEYADDIEAVDILEDNKSGYDAVWMSNSVWLYMLNNVSTSESKSTNINPVVFGIKKSKAQSLGFVDKDVYNKDIVDAIKSGKLSYVMTSVTRTNTGLISYFNFLTSLAGSPEILTEEMLNNKKIQDDMVSLFKGVERVSGSSTFLEEMFLNSSDYEAVVATESSLISINKRLESDNKEPLYLIYPVDGVAVNDSPFAYIDNGYNKLETFKDIQTFLLSNETQQKLERQGKRTWYGGTKVNADKDSFKKEWGIDTTKYLIASKYPSREVMDDAIQLYIDKFRKPSYTVFCLDYSGSMSGEGKRGLDEAMAYVLNPEEAKNEYLQFSSSDEIVILPFETRVGDPWEAKGDNSVSLIPKVQDKMAYGSTNLYGCAIKALKLTQNAPQDYTKTVILMTDGQSNYGTYSELEEEYELSDVKPPMYSIMFGSADDSQLNEIAALTQAKVFDGRTSLIQAFKEARSYN